MIAHDDGTTHLVFEPLVFLERLAGGLPPSTDGGSLVPPPKSHTVLYHGLLSSHAAWRAELLPEAEPVASPVSDESPALHQSLVAHNGQLALFGGAAPVAAAEPPGVREPTPVEKALKEIDVDTLTPRTALEQLYRCKSYSRSRRAGSAIGAGVP